MSSEEQPDKADVEEVKVEKLVPRSRQVNVTVKVVSKEPPREVISRRDGSEHRVADVLVGDETGSIIMTLWDDAIDKANEADIIDVKNGYISLFKGSMRLNTGKYGSFDKSEKTIDTVNTENKLSDRQFEEERRYSPFGGGGRDDRRGGGGRDDRRGGGGYRQRRY